MRNDEIRAAGELVATTTPAESAGHLPEYLRVIANALLHDTWDVHTGLSEIVRDGMRAKNEKDQLDSLHLFGQLKAIWDSGNHKGQRFPPQYFAEWARAKGMPLSWEEWAYSRGTFTKNISPNDSGQSAHDRLFLVIAVLLEITLDPVPKRRNQSGIVSEILEQYTNVRGLSQSQLNHIFADAKKILIDRKG